MPKKIQCLRPISAIKILNEIINFDAPENRGKIAVVADHLADELLKMEGFKLLERIDLPEEKKEIIKKKAIEVWPKVKEYFKKLLGGKK